jgi:hypothetical protein
LPQRFAIGKRFEISGKDTIAPQRRRVRVRTDDWFTPKYSTDRRSVDSLPKALGHAKHDADGKQIPHFFGNFVDFPYKSL